jgi:hypothetical protein
MTERLLEIHFFIFGILFVVLFAFITMNINKIEKSSYFGGTNLHLYWNYVKVCWLNIEAIERSDIHNFLKMGRVLNSLLLIGIALFILSYFLILNIRPK